MKKALVLYSGGLDSRLVVKILEEQGFLVEALYFNLPFGCGCCNLNCNFNFTQKEGVKLSILDCNKEPLLSEYLSIIKNPKFGTGTGANPCKDCKIFMFKKAKEYAEENKLDIIASGEVVGQRPMSQIPKAIKTIDSEIDFEILRPLSAKLLPPTKYEKKGIIKRETLYGFKGRSRKPQMALAEKFNIRYPNPAGGCFLCEKEPSNRIKELLALNLLNEKTIPLSIIGRHFLIEGIWFVVARNEEECNILDQFDKTIIGKKGKPSVYFSDESGKEKAKKLANVYSTGKSKKQRDKFKEYKI